MLRYEYKFLENKERLMTLRKVEVKDQKRAFPSYGRLRIGHIRKARRQTPTRRCRISIVARRRPWETLCLDAWIEGGSRRISALVASESGPVGMFHSGVCPDGTSLKTASESIQVSLPALAGAYREP